MVDAIATVAVVMVETQGGRLLTVAVWLPGGTKASQHELEWSHTVLGGYSRSNGRFTQRCECTARVSNMRGG